MENPRKGAKGENGRYMITQSAVDAVISSNIPGLLFMTDFFVRTTKMISNSVMADSKNHPV